jgi:predicted lipid-binding transport protein (Tim44 family)
MKPLISLAVMLLVGLSLGLAAISDADAKRLGGGRSFGGNSMFSTPYKRATPPRQATRPSPAQQKNEGLRQSLRNRGGLMGMLGGLALGGLLGALFFGGAFENINFLDILMFAGIAFLLYRLLAARRRAAAPAQPGGGASAPQPMDSHFRGQAPGESPRGFNTDLLFKDKPALGGPGPSAQEPPPQGFDAAQFLDGAKRAYHQLQAAWDSGDLEDIRDLTTDAVFREIEAQYRQRQGTNRTEVIQLDAELLEVREVGGQWEAAVLFDALLREIDGLGDETQPPHQVREVWHFVHDAASTSPKWHLDGIQQLED